MSVIGKGYIVSCEGVIGEGCNVSVIGKGYIVSWESRV